MDENRIIYETLMRETHDMSACQCDILADAIQQALAEARRRA